MNRASPQRNRFVFVPLMLALGVVVAYACWSGAQPPGAAFVSLVSPATSISARSAGPATTASLFRSGSRKSFARLQKRIGAQAGLAVGDATFGGRSFRVGHELHGRSWSTIKVPISHAVIAEHGGIARTPANLREDIHLALTKSDNDAAERLFKSLGSNREAVRRVNHTLELAGDRKTKMRAGRGWGTTYWTLSRQQRFAAGLRCLPYGKSVLKRMRGVISEQRWGLGHYARHPAFKGGWGPGPGGYLVRQFGQLSLKGGKVVAVALFAKANDGSFESGTDALTDVTNWLKHHLIAARAARPSCAQ